MQVQILEADFRMRRNLLNKSKYDIKPRHGFYDLHVRCPRFAFRDEQEEREKTQSQLGTK